MITTRSGIGLLFGLALLLFAGCATTPSPEVRAQMEAEQERQRVAKLENTANQYKRAMAVKEPDRVYKLLLFAVDNMQNEYGKKALDQATALLMTEQKTDRATFAGLKQKANNLISKTASRTVSTSGDFEMATGIDRFAGGDFDFAHVWHSTSADVEYVIFSTKRGAESKKMAILRVGNDYSMREKGDLHEY